MSLRTLPNIDSTAPLAERLRDALGRGGDALDRLAGAEPHDDRDALLALATVHDLHVAPLESLGGAEAFQHHPAVAALKWRLEEGFLARLEAADAERGWDLPEDPVAAVRAIQAAGLVPDVYRWVAEEATWPELVEYLALEGGPDGGFDDLVALCQVGLSGGPKVELAQNYWDEMGNGQLEAVHTELHHRLVEAAGMPRPAREDLPTEALERTVLGTTLATNRRLQPEMIGACGLLELQAGPRCRKVVQGLRRLGAPVGTFPFYEEHAVADPRHGRDWMDKVLAPLAASRPEWRAAMVRGARWRSTTNAAFFDATSRRFRQERAAA